MDRWDWEETELRAPPFETLKANYEALFKSCQIRPEHRSEVTAYCNRIRHARPRYEAVAAKTAAPWWFIGIAHMLECDLSFKEHLHNGDPLTARTVNVPKGHPDIWNPPTDWEHSAIDAITIEQLAGRGDWSMALALYRWEHFNGYGYYQWHINSPYLWSFSQHYTKGKFDHDHHYNPELVSAQCGGAVVLRALYDDGTVTFPP